MLNYTLTNTYTDIWWLERWEEGRIVKSVQVNPIQADILIKTFEEELYKNGR